MIFSIKLPYFVPLWLSQKQFVTISVVTISEKVCIGIKTSHHLHDDDSMKHDSEPLKVTIC